MTTPTTKINSSLDLRSFYDDILEQYSPSEELFLQMGEVVFKVISNHKPLITKLERYFSEFLASNSEPYLTVVAIEAPALDYEPDSFTVKNPEPGKRKIKEEFFNTPEGRVVRKRLTDMMFFFGQDFHLGIGPCEANDNQIINFINNRFLEMRLNQGSQLGHAAAVFNPRTQLGMMFAGFSGAGKSTLSLEVMKSDLSFLSNDRVLTSIEGEGLKMEGIPKHPRINPGTIVHNDALKSLMTDEDRKRYLEMGDDLWDLEEKYDGFIDQCFGKNKFKLVHPCQFLMLLNWKRNSSPLKVEEINLRERRDLMPAFMKQTGLFYLPDEAGKAVRRDEDDYLKHLERIKVYEVSGGVDFKEAAKICTQLLKSNEV